MNVTTEVQGLKGIEDALSNFAPNLVKKSFRKATKAAQKPQIAAAEAKAPLLKKPHKGRYPGQLRNSIIGTVKVDKHGVRGKVGPRREKGGTKQDPGAWGLMEEFGSIHNPPQPYLRPAFDETKDQAVNNFADVLRADIETMKK